MGYFAHDTIVVTAWDKKYIEGSHAKAVELFGTQVSDISEVAVNGHVSFFVPPDGSKEWWNTSDENDVLRAELITFMKKTDDFVDFVEVRFGGDFAAEHNPIVTDHN